MVKSRSHQDPLASTVPVPTGNNDAPNNHQIIDDNHENNHDKKINSSLFSAGANLSDNQQEQYIASSSSLTRPSNLAETRQSISTFEDKTDIKSKINNNHDGSHASSGSSVALDNLIDQFDGKSVLSKSASILTFFYSFVRSNQKETQNDLNDDTLDNISGSYYSAVPDTISMSDFKQRKIPHPKKIAKDNSKEEHLYLWQTCDNKNIESEYNQMETDSDFQVFWNDISCEIKPKLDLNYISERLKSTCNLDHLKRLVHFNDNSEQLCSKPELSLSGPDNNVTILNHVDGSFKSGELTALMGPSGAGKTSLLNFLARRKEENYSGSLTLTGRSKKIKISMIPQHDSLPANLTVRENLMYASRLKNSHIVTDHKKNTETIATLLGIDKCLETKTKMISGGEQKRLSIGQELVSKPDVLILDEPTSGLDSLTCYKTLSILRQLVRASSNKKIDPIAIVLSIHQPQQEVFELFDKIYIISKGGIPIYDGPPTDCVQYVEDHVNLTMPSSDYNPASFMIEIASGEYGRDPIIKLENQLKINFKNLVNRVTEDSETNNTLDNHSIKWKIHTNDNEKLLKSSNIESDSTLKNEFVISSTRDHLSPQKCALNIDNRIPKASSTNTGQPFHKTAILLERCWVSELKDPTYSIVKFVYFLVTPIVLSMMIGKKSGNADGCPRYIQSFELRDLMRNNSELLDKKVQEELLLSLENLGLYFMTVYAIVTAIIGSVAVTFTIDIRRSLKEFHNGWYSMSCYLVARIVSDIPLHALLPTMTMTLMYILTGQRAQHGIGNEYRFLLMNGGILLCSFLSQLMGMVIGAIFIGDITTALFVSQGITLPFVFVSGFVARTKNLSRIIHLFSYASFLKHTLDIAVIARYGFGACNCNSSLITGKETQLLGVPDRLKSMTDLWLSSVDNDDEDNGSVLIANSSTTTPSVLSNSDSPKQDIFQLFARQVFLYNSRGLEIKSCKDMIPYQMNEVSLEDNDMYFAYTALLVYIATSILLLFITVKCVMLYKKSL